MGSDNTDKGRSFKRPTKREYYLDIARVVSSRSTCLRRKYGSIIVSPADSIVSTGYNGSPRGEDNCCDTGYCERAEKKIPSGSNYELCRSIHAEMNACLEAGRKEAMGGTLYLYGEDSQTGKELDYSQPCLICRKVLINSGIKSIITRKNGDIKEIFL